MRQWRRCASSWASTSSAWCRCAWRAGKVYGVEEWLLPALTEMLDEAHAVGLLRVLRIEFDAEKVRKVLRQMKSVAMEAGKLLWRSLTTPRPPKDKAAPDDAAQRAPR